MKSCATDVLLALLVASAWLGAAGFVRLRAPLDRLHCATFVNATCGPALLAAALLADGLTGRVLKILLLVLLNLLTGAALSAASGRAILHRKGKG